jgi:hypothetical protein
MFAFFINCILEHAIHKYIIEKMEQIKNDFIICLQSNKKLGVVKTLRLLDMIEKTMFFIDCFLLYCKEKNNYSGRGTIDID